MVCRLLSVFLIVVSLSPSALACNWYRTGTWGETLECRTSFHGFWNDSERVNEMFNAAKIYAQGQIAKISNESWAVRNLATMDNKKGNELFENRIQATDIINEMNTQLRRRAAMDEALEWEDLYDLVPSAFMVGVTFPFNPKLGWSKVSEKTMAALGGSAFVGIIAIPQYVHWVMDNKGNIEKADYPALEWSPIIVPSGDVMISTSETKYKKTDRQLTVGFVFGENIYGLHQLLGHGWSVSFPTQFTRYFLQQKNLPIPSVNQNFFQKLFAAIKSKNPFDFLTAVTPDWLLAKASPYFDTIKIGVIGSYQDPEEKVTEDSVKSFSPNLFVWLRHSNSTSLDDLSVLERVAPAPVAKAADTVEDIVESKVRASAFMVALPKNDGISGGIANGFNGDGTAVVSNYLKSLYENFGADEDLAPPDKKTEIEVTIASLQTELLDIDAKRNVIGKLKKEITESTLSDDDKRAFTAKVEEIEAKLPQDTPPQAN